MAVSQAAGFVEKVIGHTGDANTEQNLSNPAKDAEKYADPSGVKMNALVWNGKYSVKVVETFKPAKIEDTDVVVKVTGSTVCGSDLHLYHGIVIELQKGDILGHEFCGVVDSVGSKINKVKPGDRVVCSFQIACGSCMYCKRKLSSQCEKTNDNKIENIMYGGRTAGFLGYSHFTGGYAGGQAEYVRVAYGDANLLKLPDDVPDEKGLYLSDVLSTSWNAVVDTGVKEGDVVAIWGVGPVGQMAAAMSFMQGAKRVIIIDGGAASWRLDFVKSKLPSVETINFTDLPKGKSIVAVLKEMEHGGPDVAIECVAGEYAIGWAHYFEMLLGAETDTSEIVNEMIMSVKNFGRCGITGVYVGYTNHFNIGALMERGIRLIGNGQAPVHLYWEDLLKKIQEGKLDVYQMLSHRVKLDELAKVYQLYDSREKGLQKVFVETKFSFPRAEGTPELTTYGIA
jgi:threonine dehydrogenase-like Zn-dependent dehydrogenase